MVDIFKRNRYFLRFFLSRFISRIGDGIHSLILLWLTYKWSHSALIVALVMVSFSLPAILVAPFAGSLADRKKRQKIMVITDTIQALCTAVLAGLSFYGMLNLTYLVVFTVVMSIATSYFSPATMSLIPQIVKNEDITRANGIVQVTSSFSVVIGPIIGVGLIATIGLPLAFLTNSISFVISALLLFGIKTDTIKISAKALSFFETIKDGFATIKKYPMAAKLLDKTAVINFFFAAITIVIPIFAGKIYHMGSKGMGLMMSSYGLGMFVSSILIGSAKLKIEPRKVIVFSIFIVGLMFMLFGEVHIFFVTLTSLFFIGFFLNVANIHILSLYQSKLPNNVLGRIMSFLGAISMSLSPVSYAVTGVFIDLVGIRWVLFISGLFIIVNAMRINSIKEIREVADG